MTDFPETPRVVRGRRVVLPSGVAPAAIHVRDGRIARIAGYDDVDGAGAAGLLDAGELAVLPGLVDTHVHINEPGRTGWEGFATATRAAAAGGVTTLLDMPLNSIPATTTEAALRAKRESAHGQCHVDVGFIGGVVPGNRADLRGLHDAGVFSFKCFLVPSGVEEFEHVSAGDLERALPILADAGTTLMVHAELPDPIERALRALTGDPRSYATYLASRPPLAETSAIELLIALAEPHGARVHVVHVSAAESIPLLSSAKRRGVPITAETCPHYLVFASDEIPDGATQFKCAPPIRDRATRDALWRALERGTLDCVVSDHSPAPSALKLCAPSTPPASAGDFVRAWGGIASLELTLAAVWTSMRERGLDVARLAQWMGHAPARLFGLARKGRLAPGYDADIAMVDLDTPFTVDASTLHQRHPVTPYARRTLAGRVAATYLRGELVYADGRHHGPARGQLLRRG